MQFRKEKEEQHRFFFWYKKENKAWIKNTLSKLKRTDLLDVLLPENNSWRKNKAGKTRNTFDETITEKKSPRRKNKYKKRRKR